MALVLRDTDKELEERMRDSEDPDGTVEAFTELAELLNDQSSFYRGVLDIMNTAAMRLEIVLGRVANIVDEIDGHEGHHPT